MFLRSILCLGLLACAGACGGSLSDDQATAAELPAGSVETARLEIEGDQALSVVARGERPLRVRYVDLDGQPLASKEVQFALSGSAEGASLSYVAVVTDAEGRAESTLTAGGTVSAFQVRVSANGALPAYFDVRVVAAARPTLTLRVAYEGQRQLESRRISVVNNMTCDQVRQNSAEAIRVSYVLGPNDEGIEYREMLGAGSPYVAFAWGSDETNSTLAMGCTRFSPPVTERTEDAEFDVTVPLTDIALTLAEGYDVTLALDLSGSLASLAARTASVVDAALPTSSTADASFLLDQLSARLDATARTSLGLDAALASLLTQSNAGPSRFFGALSSAVAEESMNSSLEGRLTPARDASQSRFEVTRIVSMRGGKSAREVDLSSLRGAAELRAHYDDALAALTIETLRVPLGFGRFAVDLFDLVQLRPDAYGAALSASYGCAELARLVSDHAAAFPGLSPEQAASLCTDAMQSLVGKVRADWASLDGASDALQLKGQVYVHDRDGDAEVDDLGPSPMSGTWMSVAGSETTVSATLRVTPKSALTI